MKKHLLVCAAAVAALAATAVPAGASAAGPHDWGGVATFPANRTVGTYLYDAGTLSYTDRWGDNLGANRDGKHREDYFGSVPAAGPMMTYGLFGMHRLATNGDYVLPNDDSRFPELTADLVFAQFRPAPDGSLDVRLVMNALGQPDSTIATLALSTRGGNAASSFPRNAGVSCGACGVNLYVTVWGTGGEVADARGSRLGGVDDLRADTVENTISFRVPAALLGTVGRSARAWLAVGLNDGTGNYLTVQPYASTTSPGGGTGTGPNVFDLAFVQEDRSAIDDRVQSDLLATGDVTRASALIDFGALRSGVRRLVGEPTSGPVERVLVSSLNLGEGIDTGNGSGSFQSPGPGDNMHYLGRLQPYLVDLPDGFRRDRLYPAVVALHGYNGYYDELYFLAPNERRQLESNGFVTVYPLGRGDVQYEHDGELDVVEATRDAFHAFPIDTLRINVTGPSMGGFGTTKMATRHPDLFASGAATLGAEQNNVNVVNDRTTSYPATRLYSQTMGNLQDTPMFIGEGAADADAGGTNATYMYTSLAQLGDEVHELTYAAHTHEYDVQDQSTPLMLQLWQQARAAALPARVSYAFDTTWDFGPLVHPGVWWLAGLSPRTGTQGRADGEALTLPRAEYVLSQSRGTYGMAADRSLGVRQDAVRQRTGTRPTANSLTLAAVNLASMTVDASHLAVNPKARYCVDITSDGPTAVVITGLARSGLVIAGAPGASLAGGTADIPAGSGTTHVVIAPAGTAPLPGTPC